MKPIRILSIMEAAFVTGPAKNLLELAERGAPEINLRTATYERPGVVEASTNPFVLEARRRGIAVTTIPEAGRFDRAVPGRLRELLEREQPDIVQTHNVKSHFFLRLSGAWKQYRWLAFHHGYVSTDLKQRLYNKMDRWSLRAALGIVTVCGPFRDQLTAQGIAAERVFVRHNAVRPFVAPAAEVVRALRRDWDAEDGCPVLVQVGRLSLEKGHVDLIAALGLLRDLPWRMVIVGEGHERQRIAAAAVASGVADRVHLVGHQDEVRPYLAAADMFVMPSHSEGSPNAMLEAMAAGLPIVACAVGGIPELVEDEKTALLGPPRDVASLATCLRRVLTDFDLARKLGEAARAAAMKLDYEHYREAMLGLYRRVVEAPAGGRLG
jgi:glycosyltransferase involved in cell wall biosynthesis